ncbi:MAG: hypothetical protein AB7I37_26170 [Pirellulales bacterium]
MPTTKETLQAAVDAYFASVDVKEAALVAQSDASSALSGAQVSKDTADANVASAKADLEAKKQAVIDALGNLADDDPNT